MPLDYLLALALITAPYDAPLDPPHVPLESLQAVALSLEILDPRETRYMFTRREDVASDLKVMRRRWSELKDAPPDVDRLRWPGRKLLCEMIAFNREYRHTLEAQAALYPADGWAIHEAIAECDRLYQVWDTCRDAESGYYYLSVRRGALKRLRELVGGEAYYAGCLPPPVPVWRFVRID